MNNPPGLSTAKGLEIAKFVLPLILAIAGAYGTIKYTSGTTDQRLSNLESRIKSTEDKIDKMGERTVSREELRQFIEATRSDLSDIKQDLRVMRNR